MEPRKKATFAWYEFLGEFYAKTVARQNTPINKCKADRTYVLCMQQRNGIPHLIFA